MNILFNRKYLISFLTEGFIFAQLILRIFYSYVYQYYDLIYHLTAIISVIWGCIILFHDLFLHKMKIEVIQKIYFLFGIFTLISLGMNYAHLNLLSVLYCALAFLFGFIIFTMPDEYSHEEMQDFIFKLGKAIILTALIINTASCVLYYLAMNHIPIPFISNFYPYYLINMLGRRSGSGFRFSGLYLNYSSAGFLSNLALILSLYLLDHKKISIPLFCINGIFCDWMIYTTENRTSMIIGGLILLNLIYLLLKRLIGKKWSVIVLLCALLAGILYYVLFGWFWYMPVKYWVESMLEGNFDTFNLFASERFSKWKACMEAVSKRPFTGYGFMNISLVEENGMVIANQHNLFFNLLSWTGYPGTIAFTVFLILAFRGMHKNKKLWKIDKERWLAFLVIAVFIESLMDLAIVGDFAPGTVWFWMVLGYFYYYPSGKTN